MKTLKTLLVPIDGSEACASAIDYALRLAQNQGAEVTFCHSVDITGTVAECTTPYSVGDIGPILDALDGECRSLLSAAHAKAKALGIPAQELKLAGPPVGAIVEAARERATSTIVMGTHGRGGVSGFFLGSVTEGVLRQTDLPVFAIAHVEDKAPESPLAFSHIVVAVDDSDPADAAVDFALGLAEPAHTTIELVHVLHSASLHQAAHAQRYDFKQRFDEERAAAEELLENASDRLRERDIKVQRTMIEGAPPEEIVTIAERRHTDLIVIGTHGRRGLQRLFLGSIAEHVVRSATVPVAVVRRRITPMLSERA